MRKVKFNLMQAADELLKDKTKSNLDHPSLSQPVCTALQVAIVELLRSWNIKPVAVVGHSSGEIAAAYAAGAITAESAWKIAYCRGVVIDHLRNQRSEAEAMMAVALSEQDALKYLDECTTNDENSSISVACINGPDNVTISGSALQIDALCEKLAHKGIFARKLKVDTAYHSKSMKRIAAEYEALIQDLLIDETTPATVAFFSSLTGHRLGGGTDELRTAAYWVDNLTQPVQFLSATTEMCESVLSEPLGTLIPRVDHLLEIGPHAALRNPVKSILNNIKRGKTISYSSVLIRDVSALESSLKVAGSLHCVGYPVQFSGINHPQGTAKLKMLTDAPEYPFNHSQRYWTESRLSRNFRFRKHPEHELLGVTVPDWNPLDARWRKIIRLTEGQGTWVADHVVNGTILYPGAGMIMMAIEAARILASPGREISGFKVHDTYFSKVILIPSNQPEVEVEISLRPVSDLTTESSTWREFRLFVNEKEDWSECCRGVVIVEYNEDNTNNTERNIVEEDEHQKAAPLRQYQEIAAECGTPVDHTHLYSNLKSAGLEYGPSFQVLNGISVNQELGAAVGEVSPCTRDDTLVVHPAALDGTFQLMVLALAQGAHMKMMAMLPTSMENLWITAKKATNVEGTGGTARVGVWAARDGLRTAKCSTIALDAQTNEPLVEITGLRATSVEGQVNPSEQKLRGPLCYNMSWKPDLQLMERDEVDRHCEVNVEGAGRTKGVELLDLGAKVYIAEAIRKGLQPPGLDAKPHLQRYHSWMMEVLSGDLANDIDSCESLLRRVKESGLPESKLLMRLGENLGDIVSGTTDALEIFFNDEIMDDFYAGQVQNIAVSKLKSYLEVVAHKNPNLKILEVGAGTGSMTRAILQALANRGENGGYANFSSYAYTDISASFFEKAQDLFEGWEDRVTFKTLDLEKDALNQGFVADEYDLVIAANTLHATTNIASTLQNIRRLLKPGGQLLLFELTVPQTIRTTFMFGVLAGWWLSTEDYRKESPLLTPEGWRKALWENGFSGTDCHWPDDPDDAQRDHSVMIATAVSPVTLAPDLPAKIFIVVADDTSQATLVQELETKLKSAGVQACEVRTLESLRDHIPDGGNFIFLSDLHSPILSDMTATSFSNLQEIIKLSHSLIWVSQACKELSDDPKASMATGLARTVKSEGHRVRFVTLVLQDSQDHVRATNLITKVSLATIKAEDDTYEPELEERDGFLHISRITEDSRLSEYVSRQSAAQVTQTQKFGDDPTRRLMLSSSSPGHLDKFEFTDDKLGYTPLAADEIEVEVKASGLILRDLLIAMGTYNDTRFGLEFAGIVTAVGEAVELSVGDRVFGWSHGSFGTHARCKAATVASIPDGMSWAVAATFPVAYCIAYHALVDLARIRRGDSVLIHSAAGDTGQAAVQLAKSFGAEIFATIDSEDERSLVTSMYGIPDDHIFSSRSFKFKAGIERMTNKRGVDIVLNSLTDEAFVASLDCIAAFGRFIEIGWRKKTKISVGALAKNAMFAVADLSHMLKQDPALLGEVLQNVVNLINEGTFSAPQPMKVYKSSEIEEAFKYMQSDQPAGKVVVEFGKEDLIKVCFVPARLGNFNDTGSRLDSISNHSTASIQTEHT